MKDGPVRTLVTGATGFVGGHLRRALSESGHQVVAATRRPDEHQGSDEPVEFDLDQPETFASALKGCDAAYYLVHSMEAHDFAEKDRRAAEHFAKAAAAEGVRVIYLGGLGPDDAPSEHLRSRHEVGEILRAGADTVELRAAVVLGKGSASFEILRQLVERLPAMVCPKWVATRCQPVSIADVIRYLVGSLEIPAGRYDIGGADILTYEQMLRRYADLVGKRRVIVKVPVLTPRLSSLWLGLVTDQPPSVARPLAEGLAVEVVVKDNRIRDLVPFEPLGYDEAVRAALAS